MRLYTLLFFIPFVTFAQNTGENFDKNQPQDTNKLQYEIYTRKKPIISAYSTTLNRTRDEDTTSRGIKLEAVFIESEDKFKTKKYGFYKQNFFYGLFNFSTFVFSNGEDFQQIGVYIAHPLVDKKIFIKDVLIRAWSKNPLSLAKIRIHLYPINRRKKIIGYDLLKKEHIIQLDKEKSMKTIDITDEHILFPKTGFLLSIEKVNSVGEAVVQMTKPSSGNSNSYYINHNINDIFETAVRIIPLGGKNRKRKEILGLRQLDFMIGISADVVQ